MSNTRKEFDEWARIFMDKNERAPYSNEIWQACQQLNDKRIADLLALVAKKDEALNLIHREHGLATALDAIAITVDDVELVKLPILFMGEPAYSIKKKANQ